MTFSLSKTIQFVNDPLRNFRLINDLFRTRSRFPYDYEITKLKLLELSEKCFSLITRNREEWLYWDKIGKSAENKVDSVTQ